MAPLAVEMAAPIAESFEARRSQIDRMDRGKLLDEALGHAADARRCGLQLLRNGPLVDLAGAALFRRPGEPTAPGARGSTRLLIQDLATLAAMQAGGVHP